MKRYLLLIAAFLALFTGSLAAQSRLQVGNITATAVSCTSINGASSNGACVAMQIPVNDASATIQLRGTFTGTVQFEQSSDGVNFYAITGTGTTNASSATAVGLWQFQVSAMSWLRARASAFASGPIVVRITSSLGPSVSLAGATVTVPATIDQGAAGAAAWPVTVDTVAGNPCMQLTPTFVSINQAAAGPLVIVTGTAAKKTYVCSLALGAADVVNATLIQGNGVTCGTGTVGLIGGTTAAAGISLGAGASFHLGDGIAPILATSVNADDICLVVADTTQVSGTLSYVQK